MNTLDYDYSIVKRKEENQNFFSCKYNLQNQEKVILSFIYSLSISISKKIELENEIKSYFIFIKNSVKNGLVSESWIDACIKKANSQINIDQLIKMVEYINNIKTNNYAKK